MFEFFNLNASAYARRMQTMLREARFAQLEHAAAAEHHDALARMYAERVERLEAACTESAPTDQTPFADSVPDLESKPNERAPFRVLMQTFTGAQAAV